MKWRWYHLLLSLIAVMMAAATFVPPMRQLVAELSVLMGFAWMVCDSQAKKLVSLAEHEVGREFVILGLFLGLSFIWGVNCSYITNPPNEWQMLAGGVVSAVVFTLFLALFLVVYDNTEEAQKTARDAGQPVLA